MDNIRARLIQARENSGLTQQQAAQKLHITKESIVAWESGKDPIEFEKIPVVARAYNVTTDWVLTGIKPSPKVIEVTSDLSDRLFSEARMSTYVSAYCNARHLYQTMKALAYAREKHSGQYRKKGHGNERVPYIYHPLLLTCHALALGLQDDNLLSACLLHDVCEDCGVAVEELPVNDETKEAVRLLTKPADFKKTAADLQKYYEGIAGNRTATVVKLLDRCNNISSMATSFSDNRIADYIKETQEYINPLMETARNKYPEYSNPLFLIRYHMNSVIEALRHHMKTALK